VDPLPQFKWQWCTKCQGLAYANGTSLGPCPAGGTHDHSGSGNYFVSYDVSGNNPQLQDQWRWCTKCQGLAFSGNSSVGPCPAGGDHNHGSANYFVPHGTARGGPGVQLNWRWCNKCQGMAFAGNEFSGPCPAGGKHDHSGSSDYALITSILQTVNTSPEVQDNWQWCNRCQVLTFAGAETSGLCAAGGSHDHVGSYDYALSQLPLALPRDYQVNWRWCRKCQSLTFGGSSSPGACPAGGTHDHTGSGNYGVHLGAPTAFESTEWQWCNKCQSLAWTVNAVGPCPAGGAHNHDGSGTYSVGYVAT